jgi:hypothetical protein
MAARAILAVEWTLAAVFTLTLMVALVRWARGGGRGRALLGSAMVLLLGIVLVPEQLPQQRIGGQAGEGEKRG